MHLPSIFLNAYAIKDKGVNTIAIVSVNDAFVMNAWKRDTDQRDEATFLADGNAEFTKAIGMELDASGNGLGIRSHRYSMLVDDGVVKKLNLEPAPAQGRGFRRRYAAGAAVSFLRRSGARAPSERTRKSRDSRYAIAHLRSGASDTSRNDESELLASIRRTHNVVARHSRPKDSVASARL